MDIAPIPEDEASRLRSLIELEILDSGAEAEFDAFTQAAALVCGTPIALLSLVDAERQWFKAKVGLPEAQETPRDISFCAHAILGDGLMEVPDARIDTRFSANPLVTSEPNIRFYAAAPLRLSSGQRVGTLCVIDHQARRLSDQQRQILEKLATAVVHALERRVDTRARFLSEARYRALVEASPLGVFATDASGGCTYTNEKWRAIFGLTESQSLGFGWSRSIEQVDREVVFDAWRRAAASGIEFDMTFRLRPQDGIVRHVQTRAKMIQNQNGDIVGHVGTVEDISDRVASALALTLERQRLANIIQSTGVSTWEWHVPTGQLRLNKRWVEVIGYTFEELGTVTWDTWASLIHPDDLVHVRQRLAKHFTQEVPSYSCELRMRHRDGRWVWVLDRGRVMSWNADGMPEWMFGTHTEISELKAQAEELAKSQRFLQRTGALAGVGGWEVDLSSEEAHFSEQILLLLGIERERRLTMDEVIAIHIPEAQRIVRDAFQRAIATGSTFDLELPCVTTTGDQIWVRLSGTVETDDQYGAHLVGAFQDITQQIEQRKQIELAHERVVLATESGNVGIWDYDLNTNDLCWDERMYNLFYVTPSLSPPSFETWLNCLHPDDRAATGRLVREAINNHRAFVANYRVVSPDGRQRYVHTSGQLRSDTNSASPRRLVGVCTDVTSMRELSDELASERELLQVTLRSIADGVITTDAKGVVTWLNPIAERLTGWRLEDATGRPSNEILHLVNEETRMPAENPIEHCLRIGAKVELASDAVLLSRDGGEFGIEDSAAPIYKVGQDILGVVMVFHDVSEQRRLNRAVTFQAHHDSLTGLVNRAEFETRLARVLTRAHDQNSVHALMFIDLDQFKLVNDSCGHAQGDQLLRELAKLLGESVRARDTVARLGGDEFGVILEYCAIEQAERVAQQICDRINDFRFQHEGRRFRIGASVGLVPLDNRWGDVIAVMQAADVSCYAAKEAGRNRVHLWYDTDAAMQARQGQTQWVSKIETALEDDRLVLYFQRIDGIHTPCKALHGEILLRMLDSEGRIIMPGAFMPAVERYHLAPRLDRWVLGRTIETLSRVCDLTAIDLLCVNLSGQSVEDRAFHRQALENLSIAGPAICSRICLEITETSAITNFSHASEFIADLRRLGVRVALDDFGAGASSFGYLRSLKVDFLKIDGNLISNIMDDPLNSTAVRCFVEIAKVLQLKTIAEWVEKPAELRYLGGLGVDFAQGFLLHRPVPLAAELEEHARVFGRHHVVESARSGTKHAKRATSKNRG